MTEGHSSRAHATWSASATARNWACSGALAMAERLNRPDKESIHSARGTACHEIAERCLSIGDNADRWLDTTVKTKSHEIEIDEELCNSAQEFIDYVRSREEEAGADGWLKVEQNFSLADLKPPFDAGGTADAVIYNRKAKSLEVVDLKNGMGVVEVEANKQLRTYALGALLANPGVPLDTITVTVVQPRAFHSGGTIRSETFHVADLIEWTADLLEKMRLSAQAMEEIKTMPFAAWWSKWLAAGNHCRFCPAEGNCPKQDQIALDAAGVWFNDLDKPQIANKPDDFDPAALAEKLDLLDMIEGWIKAVRRYAHDQAESGVAIPNWQLSETIGNRKWGADEDTIRKDLFLKADLSDDEVYAPRKLKSPAQIEKVLGAKRKKLIDNMWKRDVTGRNLVRVDKTSRPAIAPAVEKHFSKIED